MLQQILTKQNCAECKGCCFFDSDDCWELPQSVTAMTKDGGGLVCEHLTPDGCGLGDAKPAECALYPFRVMRLGDYRLIALSCYCEAVARLPLADIKRFVENKQGEILALADDNPEIVKEYNSEYIILKVVEDK